MCYNVDTIKKERKHKMKEIRYGIREIATKKIVLTYHTERDAVQFCGRLNRKANDEKFEIVKIVTTIEIEEVA